MVKALHKFSLPGSAGNGWIARGLHDQLRLLECIPLTHVPQELKEPEVSWQIEFADATKHPTVRLEQGEQALRPILVPLPTRIFLLRMLDEFMAVSLHRAITAGGVGIEPTARVHGYVGRFLHRRDRKIPGRLPYDATLAAHPRDDHRPVFIVMTPARLALLAATTWPASQGLWSAWLCLALLASRVIEFIRLNRARQLTIHLIGQSSVA